MAQKPANVEWLGFTKEQGELLDFIDFLGNNGWDRNSQADAVMPSLLRDCADAGLTVAQIRTAMHSIGYDERTTRQLDRLERKRTTGRFDPPRPRRR